MIFRIRWLVCALISTILRLCLADIAFSSPTGGQVISGSTINVEFVEGDGTPALKDFTTYTLQLCAGGNAEADYTILYTFTDRGDFSDLSYSAKISNMALGGDDKNAYFLRTIGVAPGGLVYNFSPRFTLSSMTGQFSRNIQSALQTVPGTHGPDSVHEFVIPRYAEPAAPTGGVGSFAIPFSMQTGPIRYAPMAKPAPSRITANGDARQYPTSAWNVFHRSGNPQPNAQATQTEPYTYSVSSIEPTISPASPPDDMQKFLNRWKD